MELRLQYWPQTGLLGESQALQLPPVLVYGTVLGPMPSDVHTPPVLLVERSIVYGPANQSCLLEEDVQHRPFDATLARNPDLWERIHCLQIS